MPATHVRPIGIDVDSRFNGGKLLAGLKGKTSTRYGNKYEPKAEMVERSDGKEYFAFNAQISKDKKLIRLFGFNRYNSESDNGYSNEFQVGDTAEYDSYNLSYTGEITKITEKTVTIMAYPDSPTMKRAHRLDIHQFAWRNYDFNREETARKNSEMMMTL
jgi:hypothetical protein|tara:strand:+ start:4398 stop:4877 length:480 start_codon:yes stop_codon:yes gene_type:complete